MKSEVLQLRSKYSKLTAEALQNDPQYRNWGFCKLEEAINWMPIKEYDKLEGGDLAAFKAEHLLTKVWMTEKENSDETDN